MAMQLSGLDAAVSQRETLRLSRSLIKEELHLIHSIMNIHARHCTSHMYGTLSR